MRKLAVIGFSLAMGIPMNAVAVSSPSAALFKVFEMRVSKNSDCTNSVTVFKTNSPTAQDVFALPTFGSGIIQFGTYHCLMFHVGDIVTVTPGADGVCPTGVPTSLDYFTGGPENSLTPPPGVDISQTTGEDDPWIYFNDSASAVSGSNCYQPNVNCACGAIPCPLPADSVTSDQTRTLVINFTNKVDGTGTCTLSEPVFSIR